MIELTPIDKEGAADVVVCPSIDGAARVEDQKTQAGTRFAEPCRVFVVSGLGSSSFSAFYSIKCSTQSAVNVGTGER